MRKPRVNIDDLVNASTARFLRDRPPPYAWTLADARREARERQERSEAHEADRRRRQRMSEPTDNNTRSEFIGYWETPHA